LVGLERLSDRRPHELSGGEQQRVALARSLAISPRVLLLDEPLGSLDEYLRRQLLHELRNLHRREGGTFVMVTHNQEEAAAVASEVIVLNGGRVEQIGSLADVYERPGSGFVASFLGSRNILKGTAIRCDGHAVEVDVGGIMLSGIVPPWLVEDICPGEEIIYAVEPCRIGLSDRGQNVVSGRLECSRRVGATVRLEVLVSSLGVVKCEVFEVPEARQDSWELLALSWQSADGYVFPIKRSSACSG